jgi:hypothetical protein
MEELLQKLLEAEVLTEETRGELQQAFDKKLTEAVEAAKADAAADVRAELTEQWVNERDALIEAVDAKVGDFLDSEIEELKGDIERFRDLEAEAAEKLVEAKALMAEELKGDLAELVEKLDSFLEIRLRAELEELVEDIDKIKQDDFGRKIFEAVRAEYQNNFADDASLEGTLRETEKRLEDAVEALEEAERVLADKERKEKLAEILTPLSGRQKEVMEAILKNVDTDQLVEGYKTFIGRVLKETEEVNESEKEDTVLAESASEDEKKDLLENAKVKTGDNEDILAENEEQLTESKDQHKLSAEAKARLQRWAGISRD